MTKTQNILIWSGIGVLLVGSIITAVVISRKKHKKPANANPLLTTSSVITPETITKRFRYRLAEDGIVYSMRRVGDTEIEVYMGVVYLGVIYREGRKLIWKDENGKTTEVTNLIDKKFFDKQI